MASSGELYDCAWYSAAYIVCAVHWFTYNGLRQIFTHTTWYPLVSHCILTFSVLECTVRALLCFVSRPALVAVYECKIRLLMVFLFRVRKETKHSARFAADKVTP